MKNYFFLFFSMALIALIPFQVTNAAWCGFSMPGGINILTSPDTVRAACKSAKEQCQKNCGNSSSFAGIPMPASDSDLKKCASGDNFCGTQGGLVAPGSWACTPKKAALFKEKGLSGC